MKFVHKRFTNLWVWGMEIDLHRTGPAMFRNRIVIDLGEHSFALLWGGAR